MIPVSSVLSEKNLEISLTKGFVTVIDDEDFDLIKQYRWTSQAGKGRVGSKRVYASAVIVPKSGKRVSLHRFLMSPLPWQVVDHINGDALDNRRSNLRVCSQSQNMANSRRMRNNTSGFKGVAVESTRSGGIVFRAYVNVSGKRLRKSFSSKEDAALWVAFVRQSVHGEFARHE